MFSPEGLIRRFAIVRSFAAFPRRNGALIGLGVSLPIVAFLILLGARWFTADAHPPGYDLLFALPYPLQYELQQPAPNELQQPDSDELQQPATCTMDCTGDMVVQQSAPNELQQPAPRDFYVEDGQVMVRSIEIPGYRHKEQLYLFDHRMQSVREVSIDPAISQAGPAAVMPDRRVLSGRRSPDGWWIHSCTASRLVFFLPIFCVAARSVDHGKLVLTNLGARVRVQMPTDSLHAYPQIEFLGWMERHDP